MFKSQKSSQWIAWGIVGLVILGAAGGFSLDLAGCPPAQPLFETDDSPGLHLDQILLTVVPPLLYSLLGAMIISYRQANRIGWNLLILGLSFMYSFLILDYGMCDYWGILDLPGGESVLWLFNTFNIFFTGSLLLFVNLFPDGQFLSTNWRRFTLLFLGIFLIINILSLFWPGQLLIDLPDLAPELQNPFALSVNPSSLWDTIIQQGKTVSGLGFGLASFIALFSRWRIAQGEVRQQLKWLALFLMTAGTLFVSVEFIGYTIYPPIFESLFYFATLMIFILGLPLILGLAILKYRLYDVDIIINRTLVYGGLSLGIVAIYILVVAGLGAILQSQGSLVLALLATGLIAVLFQPVRDKLQQRVNRLMFGERDDPYAVLSKLSAKLQTTATPEATLQSTVETVAETLKLPFVAIELADEEEILGGAVTGKPLGEKFEIPLRYQNELVGRLVVSPRSPGESFNEKEQQLLADIAAQTGPIAHAVRLTAILQRSREKLVLTREEERRRIRRDLHDGLGPVLAGQSLKLSAARHLLTKNPDETGKLLEEVIKQNEATVAEVRRLVYELRPPVLDNLGLIGAIEQEGRHLMGKVQIDLTAVPDPLPNLPAAVEVAAFRIVMEALTNISRHANANSCQISLEAGEALLIRIVDDGIGYSVDIKPGIGLASIRERTAELGGEFSILANQNGGTQIKVILPC